ncbi:formin-binding protein [Microbotryomycetes sp. JL201]|nr:formin-binding protein [Microbotryomycetes sp. JL201]
MHASARASSSSGSAPVRSRGSVGVYEPAQQTSMYSNGAEYDFCNAFWGQGAQTRTHGATRDGDEDDWGRLAYDTVLQRVKQGTKVLEDLRAFYKERHVAAETGHLDRAILQAKAELEAMQKSHADMAALMRQQEAQVVEFLARREGGRKSAKAKYEDDALQINALHAQASLLQGRELDKATMKLDKVQQTVLVNERDYKNYVNVLKETTGAWNIAWKAFLDLCQDQEEERIEFVKGRLWDWANALSTVAMAEDESAERTRTALEQCDPATDVKLFVQQCGTGNHIPDPLPFIDAKRGTGFKQQYKLAQFSRSSSRMPGVTHSPSTVDDIARAFSSTSISGSVPSHEQPRQRTMSSSNSQNAPPEGYVPMSQSSLSVGRPPSRSANLSANSLVDVSNLAPSQETTPTKPKSSGEPGSSRFAVSPSADLRNSAKRQSSQQLASSASKPGHVQASAFQRSPSTSPAPASDSSQRKPRTVEPPALVNDVSPRKPYTVDIGQLQQRHPSPTKLGGDDDADDPLLRALDTLKTTSSPSPRSSTDLRSPQASSQRQSRTSSNTGASVSRPGSTCMQLPPPTVRPSSRQGATTPNRFSMPQPASGHQVPRPRSMSTHSLGHPDALRPHSPAPNPDRSSSPQPGMASNGFAPVSPTYPQHSIQQPQAGYAPNLSQQLSQPRQFSSSSSSSAFPSPYQSPYHLMQAPHAQAVASPAPNLAGYAQPAYASPLQGVARTASMHSGVSSAISAGAHLQYGAVPGSSGPASVVSMASPAVHMQQHQMAYYGRPPSVVAAVAPTPQQQAVQSSGLPPPTGQYTEEGRPILFYVSAMFDYQAASAEEFSFNQGDVIAVVETDASRVNQYLDSELTFISFGEIQPDGWWQGRKVGINAPIKLFPSNFTELLN